MNNQNSFDIGAKLILRGIHLELTDAMKSSFETKVSRLIRHEPRIVRIRIDVAVDNRSSVPLYVARGQIEIGGPDIQASVMTEDAYKSVDLLIDKLDRQLRKRATAFQRRRSLDDIRTYSETTAT